MNSAKATQLGRIPGLTNRKPKYRGDNGLYPFTEVMGRRDRRVAPSAEDLLDEAKQTPFFLSSTPLGRRSCVSATMTL